MFDTSRVASDNHIDDSLGYTFFLNNFTMDNVSLIQGSKAINVDGAPIAILKNNNFTNLNVSKSQVLIHAKYTFIYQDILYVGKMETVHANILKLAIIHSINENYIFFGIS